jgi:hypothetical protein
VDGHVGGVVRLPEEVVLDERAADPPDDGDADDEAGTDDDSTGTVCSLNS